MEKPGVVLKDFVRRFNASERRALAHVGGPSGARSAVLISMADHGPLSFKALAHICGLEKSRVTRLVQALEAEGLAEKTPNPEDARSTLVATTELGAARARAHLVVLDAHANNFMNCLAPADRNVAKRILGRLSEFAGAPAIHSSDAEPR